MRMSDWSSDVCSSDLGGDRREHSIGFGEGHVGDDREVVIADNVENVAADISELGMIAAIRTVVLGLDEEKAVLVGRCLGDGECERAECCHDFHSSIWFDLFSEDRKSTRLNSSH